jgi:cell division septum initiation protein DivIVA
MIRINNFTEFYNLVKSVGLQSTPPYENFVKTVDRYVSLCGCDQASKKDEAAASSKRIYESIVRSDISAQINSIKSKKGVSKIEFYASSTTLLAKY